MRYWLLTLSLRMYKATGFLRSCSPLRGTPSAVGTQGVAHRAGDVGAPQRAAAAPGLALTLVLQALLVLLGVFGGRLRLRLPLLPGEGIEDGAAPAPWCGELPHGSAGKGHGAVVRERWDGMG